MSGQDRVVLLAHGGGVPETLSIAVPVLAVVALVLMERSARRKAREAEAAEESSGQPQGQARGEAGPGGSRT